MTRLARTAFACVAALSLGALPACTGTGANEPDATPEPQPEAPPACTYPEGATTLTGIGSIMPDTTWFGAYNGNGTQFDLSMEEFHCSEEYADYDTILFVIVTEWCPNCPGYLTLVAGEYDKLQAARSLVVIADVQDRSYALPTNDMAHAYVSGYVQDFPYIRVGDASSEPQGTISLSSIFSAVPNAFFVRKSDMTVIATQESSNFYLPFEDIALNPDGDWTNIGAPTVTPNCTEADEESFEPNDEPGQAGSIGVGSVSGGVCDARPDYYDVTIEGDWDLNLEFSNTVGDLDVYVVDDQGQVLEEGGARVGSETATDNENFSYSGAAKIIIMGYQSASAPYTLTLTETP